MTERLTPPTTYYAVFGGLIALTVLTIVISFLDLGAWHLVVGLVIAVSKASLVALFFMHLLHSPRLSWVLIGSGVFWLGILILLTLSDYLTRRWLVF
jgi:cytochrome c oxidase subunit IV